MPLIKYSDQVKRDFVNALETSLDKLQTQGLTFNEFRANAFRIMAENPAAYNINPYREGELVRIAPSTLEMLTVINEHQNEIDEIVRTTELSQVSKVKNDYLRSILKPVYEFTYHEKTLPVTYKDTEGKEITADVPIWRNKSDKGVCLRFGYANGDSSTPHTAFLGDEVVHMMGGGKTGAGKSVMLNTAEASLLLEYAPWELSIVLCDFKKVEASRFASPVRTPHIDVVAATGSSEYTRSVFAWLEEELHNREALCNAFNVNKHSDLVRELGMRYPQLILIVDEFTQLFENIKTSEKLGNDHAAEDKADVNASISALARLGRSFGMHMFLTSQQLDALDSGIASQFSGGISLKCGAPVAKSLIGNDQPVSIHGKGKGYFNPDRMGIDNIELNCLVRIPYINSEPDPNHPEKPTDLSAIITQMIEAAAEIEGTDFNGNSFKGYKKANHFYNENEMIPIAKLESDLKYCKETYNRIKNSPVDLADRIHQKTLGPIIALGKPLKFDPSTDLGYIFEFETKKNQGLILNSSTKEGLYYIIDILIRNFQQMPVTHEIIACDGETYGYSKLSTLIDAKKYERPILPKPLINTVKLRNDLINCQKLFDEYSGGKWNSKVYLEDNRQLYKSLRSQDISDEVLAKVIDDFFNSNEDIDFAYKNSCIEGKDDFNRSLYEMVKELVPIFNLRKQFEFNQNLLGGHIDSSSFKQRIIWFLGLENFDFQEYDIKNNFKSFIENAPTVGIFPIFTANIWGKCGTVLETVDNIIEMHSTKDFFTNIGAKKNININASTIQYMNRTKAFNQIISTFKT